MSGKKLDLENLKKTIVFTMKILFKEDPKRMCLVTFISIVSGLIPIVSLKITQYIINALQSRSESFEHLVTIMFLLVFVNFVSSILRSANEYLRSYLSIIISYKMNYDLMNKSSSLSLEELENATTYDSLSRLQGEIGSRPFQMFSSLLSILTIISTLVASGIIFFMWNKLLFICILGFSFVHMYFYINTGKSEFIMKYNRSGQERKIWYFSFLLTHDIGFKEVKIFNLKKHFLDKYNSIVSVFIKQETKILKQRGFISFIFSLFEIFVVFFVMFFSIYGVFKGDFEIGTGLLYINTISLLQESIQSLIGFLFNTLDSSRYMTLFKNFMEIPERSNGEDKINYIDEIKLNDISFGYSDEVILKNINLKLRKNQILAIVGENGSGKSTLLKLILGLYKPKTGQLLVNNNNIQNIEFNSYSNQVSCLFQDFLKYQGTIRENINLSNTNANDEKIIDALEKANVDFLQSNKFDVLNYQLGNWFEDGNELSGGQWQKIALARFFLRQGSLVCLDEPSSSLDRKSELKIFDTFFEVCKNKIAIFVTHKIKIAQRADYIIVLKKGEIIAEGTHNQLMKESEYYKYLNSLEEH